MTSYASLITQLLSYPEVFIDNKNQVSSKLHKIFKGGAQKVHIVSDFDLTLTKYWLNQSQQQRNYYSHTVLVTSDKISKEFKLTAKQLMKQYAPYEHASDLSQQEKTNKVIEWWTKGHDAFIKEGVSRSKIREIVNETEFGYRDGLSEFVEITKQHQIPVVVFSAGIGDVIEELLNSQQLFQPHIHIVSNQMIFSSKSPFNCIEFSEPLIHMLNKGEIDLKAKSFYYEIQSRPNVILMGDSIGDIQMANPNSYNEILSIGFLNTDIDELLPLYINTFDIVLTNDTSLAWVNTLLSQLIESEVSCSNGLKCQNPDLQISA